MGPEDGKREQAEVLHMQFNKIMACPNCGYQDAHHSAFNKNCVGEADGQVTPRESLESSRLLSSKITATPITPDLVNRENLLPTTIDILTSSPQLPASSISTGILDSDIEELDAEKQELEQLQEEVDMLHGYLRDEIQPHEQLEYKVAELSYKLDGMVSNGNLVQNLVPSKEKICKEVIQVTPTILGEVEITEYDASSTCGNSLQQGQTQTTLPLDIQFDTNQGISSYDKNNQKLSYCATLTSNGPSMVSSSDSTTPLSPASKSLGTSKDKGQYQNKSPLQKSKVTLTAVYITGMPYAPINQIKKPYLQNTG
ncbi:hypothetical protein L873DRAFT_1794151 [Choiromyces venosus 120613-1]|uniref:Uncharacterized protein n=1 Tax=Choiromyces venosus 120613-1 TaxID=1336337 RepID=A0A3N4J342_9PEZI|nr:hypothetical protein L873DRAFT_1794151 [Choiromyces venosus 120613-1]